MILRFSGSNVEWIVVAKSKAGIQASLLSGNRGDILVSRSSFSWPALVEHNILIVDNIFHPCSLPCGRKIALWDGTPAWDRVYGVQESNDSYSVDLLCEGQVIKSWWIGVFENRMPTINSPKISQTIRLHESFLKQCEFYCRILEKE
jgi:hypothetical protein